MMFTRTRPAARLAAGLCLALLAAGAVAQTPSPAPPKAAAASGRAKGEFDVKLTPGPEDKESGLGRMTVVKKYHGDLQGTATGEMLSWLTADRASGVYVAIERVSGTLAGRTGSFLLHHRGVMTRGTPDLNVAIVPESGTGGLAGIAGHMVIIIAGGKHSYELEYTLPGTP